MNENYDDIDRFQDQYKPQSSGIKPGVETLPEGSYDFEVIYAELGKGGTPPESIFRLGLRVLSGPRGGTEIERPTFFRRAESINYLGGDMITLGLDAECWGQRGASWSQELQNACPKLVGRRFAGRRRDKDGYANLYVSAALSLAMTPAPAAANGQPPVTSQAPPAASTAEDNIPF